MRRSLSKALVLSFLAHYLFVLVFLGFEAEPSIEKTLPVLNVLLPERDDGIIADENALTEQTDEGANSGSVVKEQQTLDSVTGPIVEVSDLVAAESQSGSRQQLRSPADHGSKEDEPDAIQTVAEALAGDHAAASSNPVAVLTSMQSVWSGPAGEPVAAAPEPEKIPVSAPDRSMLEKKLRQWGEDLHDMVSETTNLDWEHKGQAYTASFTHLRPAGDMDMGHVVVEVTKEEGGTRFTTRMRMKNLSFSNYGQFFNHWNPGVQLHDDETDGRFHCNSEVHLAYSRKTWPVFFGKVTTSHRGIRTSSSTGIFRRNQIFPGGLETGVKRIEMPARYSPFPDDVAIQSAQVRIFEADTRITFHPDGTYGWQHIGSEDPGERVALAREGTFLVGAGKATLHVEGVLDGRVLVYSPEGIVIDDDLVYARQPDTMPESDDYLGLVTDRSIEIAGPELTGPGNLLINAAMYARRRFTVRHHRADNDGVLEIHGSLAAGSISATEPRYRTRIRFDRRLENLRPPRFPLTNRYETVAWDGEWEVE